MRIARCPRCGASTRLDAGNPWRPFCGERCKLIDLGEWFGERFGIPAESHDQEASTPDQVPSPSPRS
ncbi:MAG: DNA gyrase inhibitor YacG [Nevskia sp.]|nr:DNA gyrase inhibitor YacG [Nevskia sp.]